MDQETKSIYGITLFLFTLFLLFLLAHWIVFTGIYEIEFKNSSLDNIILKLGNIRMIFPVLFFYVLMWGMLILFPNHRLRKKFREHKYRYLFLVISLACFIVLCNSYLYISIWDYFIYPLAFFLIFPSTILAAAALLKSKFREEKFFGGASCLPAQDNFYYEYNTKEGKLRIHKPEENIFIDGGPGSGKSHYLIKFNINQAAKNQYAGVIYDYEGDPTKEGCPILTNIVYSSVVDAASKNPNYKMKFAFLNFTDMSKTVRVNILSKRYFTEQNAQLLINNIATCIMKNLEPSWKEKTDFWANNAINFFSSVMYMLYKNYSDQGLNTLPHAISLCLSDADTVFRFLSSDDEISKTMAPMISAWKMGAEQQTAGAVSSAQLPLSLLYHKEIFWVLGADEYNLDITNRENPSLLCIGNSPELKVSISPAISSIFVVVMNQMNNSGKYKSIFCIDELPTINLFGLDNFISTARKHRVSTVLAIQDFSQLVRDYGEKSGTIIRSNCGTRFQGKTGNMKTCEEVSQMLGDIKKENLSFSNQSGGSTSTTESLQREKVLQPRDISAQESGHFFGVISNGQPPFIFTDFMPFHKEVPLKINQVPPFAYKIKTKSEEENQKIHNALVKENFKKIENEIAELLEQFYVEKQ